jgi:hypothetical protein
LLQGAAGLTLATESFGAGQILTQALIHDKNQALATKPSGAKAMLK